MGISVDFGGVDSLTQNRFISRYWPLASIVAIWTILVFVAFQSEPLRLIVSIATITLLYLQWLLFRRRSTGLHLVFLTVGTVVLSIPAIWLALNVARFCAYSADMTDSVSGKVYSVVVRAQDILVWIGVVLFATSCFVGLVDFIHLTLQHRQKNDTGRTFKA